MEIFHSWCSLWNRQQIKAALYLLYRDSIQLGRECWLGRGWVGNGQVGKGEGIGMVILIYLGGDREVVPPVCWHVWCGVIGAPLSSAYFELVFL